MPYAPKLVSDLVSDLKLRMFWDSDADGNAPYTDAEIVRVGQDLIEGKIWPKIESTQEDYLTAFVDLPLITPSDWDKTPGYQPPIQGMSKILHVSYVDRSGKEQPLEEYDAREWERYGRYYYGHTDGYYQTGGRIFLVRHPNDASGRYLRVYYVARPLKMTTSSTTSEGNTVLMPRLVSDPTQAGTFTQFNLDLDVQQWESASALVIDGLSVLSGVAPHLPIEDLDVLGAAADASFTNILIVTTADIWPNSGGSIPTGARTGDFLIADRETPIVQLPLEGYRLLLKGMCAEFADARGDKDKYARMRDEFDSGLEELVQKLSPRNRDGQVYVNWSSPGRVRRGGMRWR